MTLKSIISLAGLACLFTPPATASAQSNDDCLACHSDASLTKTRAGAKVSLHVDEKAFAAAAHRRALCTDCHTDLEKKELPHPDTLARATCAKCHAGEQKQYSDSRHGDAAARTNPLSPRCTTCHGNLHVTTLADVRAAVTPAKVPLLCGRCHTEGVPVHAAKELRPAKAMTNYAERIHGKAIVSKGLVSAATCTSCHTAHAVLGARDERSSVAPKNTAATCGQCHTRLDVVHAKVIPADAWKRSAGATPACTSCHETHRATVGTSGLGTASRECMRCHTRSDIKSSRDGHAVVVDAAAMAGSVHASRACGQCHTGLSPSHAKGSKAAPKTVDCSACHAETARLYRASTHGLLEAKRDTNAPTCQECHGTHDIRTKRDPKSVTFPTHVPDLCARCHRTGEKAAVRYSGQQTSIVERYTESIHGKGLRESGLIVSAVCTSCHTAHSVLPKDSVASSVNAANVPATCGACHEGIQEKFETSVHSNKVNATDRRLPACNDCHSAHMIQRTANDAFKLTIMSQCGTCHEQITKTYFDTYHGKVSQLGYTKTAQCYDCHGVHTILPASNPQSQLSQANIVATCAKCHPGANAKFAAYLPHATHDDRAKYPWLFYAFWGMTALLVGTFSFFWAHTLLWLPRALKLKREFGTHPDSSPTAPQYERFSRLNRVLHIIMIISFLSLTATGMSLKFSNTGWAVKLAHFLGGFQTAGYIHRVSALLLFGIFFAHLYDVWRKKHGTWTAYAFGKNSIVPNLKDLTDFIGTVKWFIGRGERPKYGRWTYWEKFDYLGVFWGVAVIGSTGLSLWFPVFFTKFLPGWLLNVATIIHSDEALLATVFIFTIHFFNTHLRPEKFPMDLVIFTGRMPIEELKHDKPLEYEELVTSGELDQHLVEPYQPTVIRAIKVFAWSALTVGVTLLLWIAYAMIFTSR